MGWSVGLHAWHLLGIMLLAGALILAEGESVLPRVWRKANGVLLVLIGILGLARLRAEVDLAVAGALLVVALAESLGLWIGIARGRLTLARGILVAAGTLCVLAGAFRIFAGALRAATSTESILLGELVAEGVLRPLLIIAGAVAIALGVRGSTRVGA
jgi:hypothetical protein